MPDIGSGATKSGPRETGARPPAGGIGAGCADRL